MKVIEFIVIVTLFLIGCYLLYDLYPQTLGKVFEAGFFCSFLDQLK